MSVVKTDAESVYVYGVFSKYCSDHGVKISPSRPYLNEMNEQAERYLGDVIDMVRSILKLQK